MRFPNLSSEARSLQTELEGCLAISLVFGSVQGGSIADVPTPEFSVRDPQGWGTPLGSATHASRSEPLASEAKSEAVPVGKRLT